MLELSHWGGVRESFLEEVALGLGLEDGWDVSKGGVGEDSRHRLCTGLEVGELQSSVGMRHARVRSLDNWFEGEWEPWTVLTRGGEVNLASGR